MKDSEIYRTAAERVCNAGHELDDRFTCLAIAGALGWPLSIEHPQIKRYVRTFADNDIELQRMFQESSGSERKNCRILALCLMAAIAESEGR